MDDLKAEFALDPQIIYLNHGSFGACPRPVFAAYQDWQNELERQPVEFLGRHAESLLAEARACLSAYLHIAADDVVFFPNPTTALNMVARSLMDAGTSGAGPRLRPGDEILTTDHEYGALDRTWRFVCSRTGARYVQRSIRLPVDSPEDFIAQFWAGVTQRTRVVYLSHITSPTALIFPVREICLLARAAGILTIVDGAHAPGQVPLDLAELGADIYAGACHKWLCAAKGSAFLYAHPTVQPWLSPLVVSWGWDREPPGPSRFVDHNEWQGTRDIAAFLSVPAAIAFQSRQDWCKQRARCRALSVAAWTRLNILTGLQPLSTERWFAQMFAARLPEWVDVAAVKQSLYEDYRIEVPLHRWNDQPLIRVSIQAYNSEADVEALVAALSHLLTR